MRRSDREITDQNDILSIISRCDVCRVAMNDGEFPYLVPLSFGMETQKGQLFLYFHCAAEGKKMDLLRQNSKVAFEMDCSHQLEPHEQSCRCSMAYESVIGCGELSMVPEEEKAHGLDVLMRHYFPNAVHSYDASVLARTVVLKLHVIQLTGKQKRPSFISHK